jgi:hypothetical protein
MGYRADEQNVLGNVDHLAGGGDDEKRDEEGECT